MGSIGSIWSAKEQEQAFQPLLLAEFTLVNGDVLRLSTHPLASGYWSTPSAGSYEYGGVAWIPRILNQDIGATQAMSDFGIDIPPQVAVVIADPDGDIRTNWEAPIGFKGATLKLYAAMWDAGNSLTGSFNSEAVAPVKFIGTCSPPQTIDQRTFVVVATSLLNMTQQSMPPIRIQSLCAWKFPPNLAGRTDGQANNDSPFYQCGYSPDVAGGVGNFESGTACFTDCDLSLAACIERLGDNTKPIPILQDTSSRHTGRFGGFDYVPVQNVGLQRPFVTGQWELIINATNEARYGDYIPLCYGTTWIEPEIMGVYGDGNYTSFEALLSFGVVDTIYNVIVNGDIVPQLSADYTDRPSNHISSPAVTNDFQDNNWYTVNTGQRSGTPNAAIGWNNKGDPYGSCAAIGVHVLASLASQSTLPQCQVLLVGGEVRVYTDPTTFSFQTTDNPAWILMDLLIQSNWRYSDINIQSFIDAAAVCSTQIYFNRLDGTYANVYNESGSPPYHRYSVGFAIKQRSAIGDVIRGVRNAMRGMLYFDFNTGLLTVMSKGTLADQQPSPITGSNYNVAVPSVTASGADANGYVAYSFDGGSIIKDNQGNSTLKISQRQFQETPNKSTNYFFDRENQYSQDISTIIDIEDVNRIGAEVSGNFNLIGPQTFDHLNRVTATWFAENYRGNPRLDYQGSFIGDTGGTIQFEFETSVKGLHLMVGQLCFMSDAQNAITNQLFRITKIQPSTNFETARITGWWHNDNWYQDTFGQGANQPVYKNPQSGGQGNPRPWRPNFEAPQAGDQYYQPSDLSFGVSQYYPKGANGNQLSQLIVAGEVPVNSFPTVPLAPQLEIVGVGDTGGGYLDSTAYFVAVSAIGSDGSISPISNIATVNLQPGDDALDVVAQGWPGTASGYFAFAGFSPNSLTFQQSASVISSLIQLKNNYKFAAWGCPDQAFKEFVIRIQKERHAGVWGAAVESVTTSSIQVAVYENYGFTADQWAGREVAILGIQNDAAGNSQPTPIANFRVASNDETTLYLSSGDPTTCVYGNSLNSGDAITMRILPTFGSDSGGNYFEDAGFVNSLNPPLNQFLIAEATNTSPITIKLLNVGQPFPFEDGQFVLIQTVGGNDGANGGFTIFNSNPLDMSFQLLGSVGTGDYTGGGWAANQDQGLAPDAEVGSVAFIIAGTGRGTWVPIASNTPTRIYIVGDWPVTPDETSRIVVLDNVVVGTATSTINNSVPMLSWSYTADVSAFGRQTVFVQVGTQSQSGLDSLPVFDYFREIFLFSVGGPLGQAPFTVTREAWAMITINDLEITANEGIGSLEAINFFVPAVDLTDVSWRGRGSLDATSDPSTFLPTIEGTSRIGQTFAAGDYFVWPNAEICQILSIDMSGVWTVARGLFGSTRAEHFEDPFYRLVPRVLTGAVQANGFGTMGSPSGIPEKWEWAYPNKTVVAAISQAAGSDGFGPINVLNLLQPALTYASGTATVTLPMSVGFETGNGAQYDLGNLTDSPLFAGTTNASGAVTAAGSVADLRIQVAAWEGIRLVVGSLTSPPSGGGFQVQVVYISPDGLSAGLIDVLDFNDGQVLSYPNTGLLESMQMPFHNPPWAPASDVGYDWPANMFPQLTNPFMDPVSFANVTSAFSAKLSPAMALDTSLPGLQFSQYGYIDFLVTGGTSAAFGSGLAISVKT